MNNGEFRDLIDRIKDRVDIVDIISESTQLDKNHKALCPFHDETHPSFSVNPEGQYFYCFGCSKSGDVLDFLMLSEGIGFWDAVGKLAHRAGILVPDSKESREDIENDRFIQDILSETGKFYSEGMPTEVREYLVNERGLTQETIQRYRIGYANWGLCDHLINNCGFNPDLCVQAGVLRKTSDGNLKDYFYKRIILPTFFRGKVTTLSGRALGDSEPKYLHLPGEKKYFFNEEIISGKEVYIVEGILDCLSMIQQGYPCVAIQGSNLKEDDTLKFSKCERIFLCLDGDDSGKDGALKIARMLGIKARIVEFPKGLDPNDYFRQHTKDDFESLKNSALDYICFQIKAIPPDIPRLELVQSLEPVLKELASQDEPYTQAVLHGHLKEHFEMKEKELDGYWKQIKRFKKEDSINQRQVAEENNTDKPKKAIFEGLIDIAEVDRKIVFLFKESNQLVIKEQCAIDGVIHIPPQKDAMEWQLPGAEEVVKHYAKLSEESETEFLSNLYDDVRNYLKSASELPLDEYYDLLTVWIFHTYLQEQLLYSPIICLYAEPERGKSRLGKAMIYASYRGLHEQTLREAYIIRLADRFSFSILFDVMDFWQKVEKYGCEDIILNRFERGGKATRVNPDKPEFEDVKSYSIFGPTIIATNINLHRILDTRAIIISLQLSNKRFETDITPESALSFKEKLIAFRAMYYDRKLEKMENPCHGRLGNILKPIFQVIRIVKPDRESALRNLVRIIENDRKIERSESIEAEIMQVVYSLKSEVNRGRLPVKLVADTFNRGKQSKMRKSYQYFGQRFKSLGFKKSNPLKSGGSCIDWNEDMILKILKSMGIENISETSETSEKVLDSVLASDVSDISDVLPDYLEDVFYDLECLRQSDEKKGIYYKRGLFE